MFYKNRKINRLRFSTKESIIQLRFIKLEFDCRIGKFFIFSAFLPFDAVGIAWCIPRLIYIVKVKNYLIYLLSHCL